MLKRLLPLLASAALAVVLAAPALAAPAPSAGLSADEARQALGRGVVAWDLRAQGELLPGAVRIAPGALVAWLEQGDVAALGAAVSAAGLNLGGEVLVYAGDDLTAQSAAQRLKAVSRGRVHWLAGGADAWRAAGLALVAQPAVRLPLPQRLVALDTDPVMQPADALRRGTRTLLFGTDTEYLALQSGR
jgi:rhodanese-related sulfurtransferase